MLKNSAPNSISKEVSGKKNQRIKKQSIFFILEVFSNKIAKKPKVKNIQSIFQTHQKKVGPENKNIGNFKINLPHHFSGTK